MYSFSCLVVVGLFLCCIFPLYYGNFKYAQTEREWYKEPPSPITSVNTWPILFHLYSHPTRGYFEQISTMIHKYFRMPPRKITTLLSKCNNPNITCIPWYYHKSGVWNSPASPIIPNRMTPHFWIAQGRKCIRGAVNGASRESLAAVSFFSRSLLKLPKSAGGALQEEPQEGREMKAIRHPSQEIRKGHKYPEPLFAKSSPLAFSQTLFPPPSQFKFLIQC